MRLEPLIVVAALALPCAHGQAPGDEPADDFEVLSDSGSYARPDVSGAAGWQAFTWNDDQHWWTECAIVDAELEVVEREGWQPPFWIEVVGYRRDGDGGADRALPFRGGGLASGPLECAEVIGWGLAPALCAEPTNGELSGFGTYSFGSDTLSVYTECVDGEAQFVYRKNQQRQVLLRTDTSSWEVVLLGDFDRDGSADMLLDPGTSEGFGNRFLLYLSGAADEGSLLRLVGEWVRGTETD